MADADISTMSDAERLDRAIDELDRARGLLNAVAIIKEGMEGKDMTTVAISTVDALRTCLNAADDIIEAVQGELALLLDGKAKEAA